MSMNYRLKFGDRYIWHPLRLELLFCFNVFIIFSRIQYIAYVKLALTVHQKCVFGLNVFSLSFRKQIKVVDLFFGGIFFYV